MDLAVKESQGFRCIVSRIVYCSWRHHWNYKQKLQQVYTYFRLHFIFHNVNIWFWVKKYNAKPDYLMKRKTMFWKLVSDLYVYMFHSIVQDCFVLIRNSPWQRQSEKHHNVSFQLQAFLFFFFLWSFRLDPV